MPVLTQIAKRYLGILTEKTQPQLKLERLQKV